MPGRGKRLWVNLRRGKALIDKDSPSLRLGHTSREDDCKECFRIGMLRKLGDGRKQGVVPGIRGKAKRDSSTALTVTLRIVL